MAEQASRAGRLLDAALVLHRAGDLPGAAALYQRLLHDAPGHVDALHLLGVVEAQSGHPEAAIAHLGKALALRPRFAQAHVHLGNVYRELGRHEQALAAYRQAVGIEPARAGAWMNLGVCAGALGREDEALAAYRRAIALQPDNADSHYNLGCTLHRAGRLEDAIAAYRRAVALRPEHADAHGNLGAALQTMGRLTEALAALHRQVELAPISAEAHVALSAVLISLGGFASASSAAQTATVLAPDSPHAWQQLGQALHEEGRHGEAITAYHRAVALADGSLTPTHSDLLVALAITQQEAGQVDAARACVEKALAANPTSAAAWSVLGGLKRFSSGDPDIAALERLVAELADMPRRVDDLIHVEFTLGKALMDAGDDTARAFAALTRANRHHRTRIAYDVDRDLVGFCRNAQALEVARAAPVAEPGTPADRPIFIVGMPRSGTTLVEQILAAHPQVHGGGEMKHLDIVLMEHFNGTCDPREWGERLRRLDRAELARLGRAYLARIAHLAPPGCRITDKMPSNFRHLGIIRMILPQALIIHCRREPLATCLSCYATHFSQGQQFTYDLGELGTYYRAYARLMQDWRQVIPADALVEVDYENVVADVEGQARRLIAACGLAWNDACLDFHRAARSVRTASVTQVRQPIYDSSLMRWQAYAPYLGALRL